MKKYLLLILFVLPSIAFSQFYYPVVLIPDSIKDNSLAVVRYDSLGIVIKSENKVILTRKRIITILDYSAVSAADMRLEYGGSIKIKKLEYNVYNGIGVKGKSLKTKEMEDYPIGTDVLFTDIRKKYAYVRYKPPYTVEYQYTIEIDNLLQIPDWRPIPYYNIGLERGVLDISYPEELPIKHKTLNYNFKTVESKKKGMVRQKFVIENFKPVDMLYLTDPSDVFPKIITAPVHFVLDEHPGSFESWKDFGNWVYNLNRNRMVLPQGTREEIKNMTDGKTDLEKIKIVYEYVRKKTRYIEVAFGIGGFQPLYASEVDQKGYGDCKALTLYTQALLKEIGIKSYYTLVKSGRNASPIVTDFPSQQFDHVILCVPLEKDTVWLENTSHSLPFNYLGSFTDNRYVLLIDRDNSHLVKTPVYDENVNFFDEHTEITNIGQRSARLEMKMRLGGFYYEINSFLLKLPESKIKTTLEKLISYGDFDILDYKITKIEDEPIMEINMTLEVRNFYKSAGVYAFFDVPYFNIINKNALDEKDSPYPVWSRRGRSINLTYVYNFSDDLTALKKQPEEINYKNSLGQVKMNINQEGNKIITTTEFSLKPYYLQAKDKGVLFDLLEKYLSISNKQFVVTMK